MGVGNKLKKTTKKGVLRTLKSNYTHPVTSSILQNSDATGHFNAPVKPGMYKSPPF